MKSAKGALLKYRIRTSYEIRRVLRIMSQETVFPLHALSLSMRKRNRSIPTLTRDGVLGGPRAPSAYASTCSLAAYFLMNQLYETGSGVGMLIFSVQG